MGDDTVESPASLYSRFVHPVGKCGMPAYSPAPARQLPTTPFLRIYKKEKRRVAGPTDQTDKPLLAVLRGERREPPPVWMMRQAGRYLAEYRSLRAAKGGFLDLVYDPEAAAEITLQPLRRFALDGAILFSDILIVPHALGQELSFVAGEGPRLSPPLRDAALEGLRPALERFEAIYGTVRRVRAALAPETTFLGFAGSPWTVATYMVAGEGSGDQADARGLAYQDPGRFGAIITAIEDLTVTYLLGQADAGVDAVQLFDSWSGSLAPSEFELWVIAPTARIVSKVRAARPELPIIGFPKGAGEKLPAYARETGVDALGLDETVDPAWAHSVLPDGLPVQGNLDPLALIAGGEALESAVRGIVLALADRPHIFNLGHGIQQTTPIAHVEQLFELLGRPS
jgi:uroporphyrinogen decarboxylase